MGDEEVKRSENLGMFMVVMGVCCSLLFPIVVVKALYDLVLTNPMVESTAFLVGFGFLMEIVVGGGLSSGVLQELLEIKW